MPTKREKIIAALHGKLQSIGEIHHNLEKPHKVPLSGLMILRDGTSSEPEIILSPLTYIYEHTVTLEILAQKNDESVIQALLLKIALIIENNRSLDGLAEWIEAKAPYFNEEAIEGSTTIRMVNIEIIIRYSTDNPLN